MVPGDIKESDFLLIRHRNDEEFLNSAADSAVEMHYTVHSLGLI